MVPSVSPNAFLDTHLYDPKSDGPTEFIVNFIWTLYALSTNMGSYFPPAKMRKLFNPRTLKEKININKQIFLILSEGIPG